MLSTPGHGHGALEALGIHPSGDVHWNLAVPDLIDMAVDRNEGVLSAHGALVTETGERTGRSPNDKFIVDESTTSGDINWGDVNVSTDLATFTGLRAKVVALRFGRIARCLKRRSNGADGFVGLLVGVGFLRLWRLVVAEPEVKARKVEPSAFVEGALAKERVLLAVDHGGVEVRSTFKPRRQRREKVHDDLRNTCTRAVWLATPHELTARA